MEKNSSFTLADLEKYRNKDGFLDMDLFLLNNDDINVEREMIGTVARVKDWITFSDSTRILLKTEPEIDGITDDLNGTIYADLIYNKLASQVGFETARTDLIIYKRKKGIYSQDVRDKDKSLKMLRDYIGDDNTFSEGYEDITDIEFVHEKFFDALQKSDLSSDKIKELINRFNKLLTLDIFCMATDNHTENIGFLEGFDSEGNKTIELSKIFDRENSLAIDTSFSNMEKISKDITKVANMVNVQDPKIAVVIEEDEEQEKEAYSFLDILKSQVQAEDKESVWEMTLDYLDGFPQVHDFITNECMNMDIDKAIQEVEKDIKTNLPECVKDMARKCFDERKTQIAYYLGLDIDIEESNIDKEHINNYKEERKNDITL